MVNHGLVWARGLIHPSSHPARSRGDQCNRLHNRPTMSQTLLLSHMSLGHHETPWADSSGWFKIGVINDVRVLLLKLYYDYIYIHTYTIIVCYIIYSDYNVLYIICIIIITYIYMMI